MIASNILSAYQSMNPEFFLNVTHDLYHRHSQDKVDKHGSRRSLQPVKCIRIDLVAHESGLGHADGHGHRRVLEDREEFRRKGRKDKAQRMGDHDVPVHLPLTHACGQSCLVLTLADGGKSGPHVLSHTACRVKPQADNCSVIIQPGDGVDLELKGFAEDHGTGIEPEEELDKEGNIPKDFHVDRAHPAQQLPWRRTHRADKDSQKKSNDPCEKPQLQSEPYPLQHPFSVRLAPQHAPVKLI